ncbi:hypothetical protein Tco_1524816 [Tanacetum coccineum]
MIVMMMMKTMVMMKALQPGSTSWAFASKNHPTLSPQSGMASITLTQESVDEGIVSDMVDTATTLKFPKVSITTWVKPRFQESERPALHREPEWTIPPNDFPEPEHNWANAYATTYKVPDENKLQRKTYDIGSFIKWFCRRTGKKKLCTKLDFRRLDEMNALSLLTNKVDLCNHEVIRIPQNLNEQLPLGGPPVRFKKCSNHLHPRRQDQYSNSSSYIWRISNPGDSESLWRVLQLLGIESYGTIPNDPAITGANLQPGTNPLVSVEVLSTGINPTIGSSHEVSLSTEGDILKMEMEMEIPSVKASANSDVKYFFTSAQVGDPSQDDVRLCLDDDLKKAQDHSQSQA